MFIQAEHKSIVGLEVFMDHKTLDRSWDRGLYYLTGPRVAKDWSSVVTRTSLWQVHLKLLVFGHLLHHLWLAHGGYRSHATASVIVRRISAGRRSYVSSSLIGPPVSTSLSVTGPGVRAGLSSLSLSNLLLRLLYFLASSVILEGNKWCWRRHPLTFKGREFDSILLRFSNTLEPH